MIDPVSGNHHHRGNGAVGHANGASVAHGLAPRNGFDRGPAPTYERGETSPKITPQFVLRSTRRWWKIATPIGLLIVAAVVTYMVMTYVPAYEASAWLRIDEDSYIVDANVRAASKTFVGTQSQLIASPLVLEQVLVRPDIARLPYLESHPAPVNYLARRIGVRGRSGSELFVISFTASAPDDAALIANAIVEAYFKMHSQDEAQRTSRVIELLEDERARRGVLIKGLKDTIRDLKEKTFGKQGDNNLMADGETLKMDLSNLKNQITALEVNQEVNKARLKAFEEDIARRPINETKIEPELLERDVYSSPQVAELQKTVDALRSRMHQIRITSTRAENDPAYQSIASTVATQERSLNELKEQLREKARQKIYKEREKDRVTTVQNFMRVLKEKEIEIKLLRDRFFSQREEGKVKNNQNLDLVFKMSELGREEAVFGAISNRISRLRTEMRAPTRISLLRSAQAPTTPTSIFPTKQVTMFALVGFCVPFALCVFWEKIVCRVDGPQQLWQADLTVVGEVAKLPVSSRITGLGGSIDRDVSLFEESIDSLRTCLVLSETGEPSRVLVVSSAVSGEGKTSVASQLAVSIARATGEPTLLIDADMRSPDIHNVFDVPNEPGLAQVLGHECSIEDAIVTSWSNYVHILPAGVLRTSPHKLLGDGAIRAFLDDVSSRYKHVIIDTSPILSASESLVLAKAADATLLCAMRDVSRVDQVQRAYERLVNTGARPLGTVLNGVPTNRYAYLYGVYAYARD